MDILTQDNELPVVNFVREGIKVGLINGAIALLLLFGGYFVGLDTFLNIQLTSSFVPYMLIILFVTGIQLRKKNGGVMTFKDGLQYAFVSYIVVTVLLAIGNYILYNLIDPELTAKSIEKGIEKTREMGERFNMSDKDIDSQVEKLEKSPKTTTIGTILAGSGTDLIWHFAKSCLLAFVIKREKPLF